MEQCKHRWAFSNYCGAHVCIDCEQHAHVKNIGENMKGEVYQELARCYCGWNLAPGERLEDDVDY